MVKELPKHTVKAKPYLVTVIAGDGKAVERLVLAKTRQGAIAFVAGSLMSATLPDGATMYRLVAAGVKLENAGDEGDLLASPQQA